MIDLHSPAFWQHLLFGCSAVSVFAAAILGLPRKTDLFQLKGQKHDEETAAPVPAPIARISVRVAPTLPEGSSLKKFGMVKAAITKTARVTYTSSQKLLDSIKPVSSPTLGQS